MNIEYEPGAQGAPKTKEKVSLRDSQSPEVKHWAYSGSERMMAEKCLSTKISARIRRFISLHPREGPLSAYALFQQPFNQKLYSVDHL
jgi:hypothetical protein